MSDDRLRQIERDVADLRSDSALLKQLTGRHESDIRQYAPSLIEQADTRARLVALEKRSDELEDECSQERKDREQADKDLRSELQSKSATLKVAAYGLAGVCITALVSLIGIIATGHAPTP